MSGEAGKECLKGVSRSFYLSLRLLPVEMRGAASLGYLLARTSDTLADTAGVPSDERLRYLDCFARSVSGVVDEVPRWDARLLDAVEDVRERRLLERVGDLLGWLKRLPAGEAALVREVVAVILGGQRLDLVRFVGADAGHPVALADEAALEDYAWRVAGCVGAFWTKLGLLTLGGRFSDESEERLLGWGIAYGKGLQLVNILRDLPADLAVGRCYIPVADACDVRLVFESHQRWVERAAEWVGEGFLYAESLRSRRLRTASVLPAMIARETLDLLWQVDWETLQRRIKVPRAKVYLALLRAMSGRMGPPGWQLKPRRPDTIGGI